MKEILNAVWVDIRHMIAQITILIYCAIAPAILIFFGATMIYPISISKAFGASIIIMGIVLAVSKALSAIVATNIDSL